MVAFFWSLPVGNWNRAAPGIKPISFFKCLSRIVYTSVICIQFAMVCVVCAFKGGRNRNWCRIDFSIIFWFELAFSIIFVKKDDLSVRKWDGTAHKLRNQLPVCCSVSLASLDLLRQHTRLDFSFWSLQKRVARLSKNAIIAKLIFLK
jgi:hypothetical protein